MKLLAVCSSKHGLTACAVLAMSLGLAGQAQAMANSSQGGSIAAVTRALNGTNVMEVFWISSAHTVNHSYWHGAAWSSETVASSSGASAVDPSTSLTAVSRKADAWEVFYPNSNRQLYHVHYTDGGGRIGPDLVTSSIANVSGGLSAISHNENHMEVFYVGTDFSIQHTYWQGNQWAAPTSLSAGGQSAYINGGVAAVARQYNGVMKTDVFYVGYNQSLQYISYDAVNGWSTPQALTGAMTVYTEAWGQGPGPSAVSRSSNTVEVFYVASDLSLQHMWFYEGQGWSGPAALSNSHTVGVEAVSGYGGSVSAVSRAADKIETFFIDNNHMVEHTYYVDGSNWTVPEVLQPNAAKGDVHGLTSVSRGANTMEVWYLNDDGVPPHTPADTILEDINWYSGQPWNWQALPTP